MSSALTRMFGWASSIRLRGPRQQNPFGEDNEYPLRGREMYSIRGPQGFEVIVPQASDPHELPPPDYIRRNGQVVRNCFGNFTPIFGGRIVLGPDWKMLLAHLSALLTSFTVFVLQLREIEKYFGVGVPFVGILIYMTTLMTLIMTSLSDPGVIPLNYNMTELLYDTDGYRRRNPGLRFYRHCSKCRGFRPPKCYHCDRCNICIRSQEVHLLAGGICVGERNFKSFMLMSLLTAALAIYLLYTNTFILIQYRKQYLVRSEEYIFQETVLSSISLVFGLILLLLPQVGIIMFIFRIYFIGAGTTTRMITNAETLGDMECLTDDRTACQNYAEFLCGKQRPSAFRKKYNQVDPGFGLLDEQWLGFPHDLLATSTDSRELVQLSSRCILNNATAINIESEEDHLLKNLAASARHQSTPSVPHLDRHGLGTVPGTRLKTPLKSKPCQIIQMQIDQFQKSQGLTKATLSYRKQHKLPSTLSEGCLPRNSDTREENELVQTARAEQFRRIIHLVLLRDREGLMRMARRVNLPALLGVDHFDPDNLQFVELSNGLPMLAPRRRDGLPAHANNPHRFGGLLGIPQMVAAGLLPPARGMAADLEGRLGLQQGSVVRMRNSPMNSRNISNPMRPRGLAVIPPRVAEVHPSNPTSSSIDHAGLWNTANSVNDAFARTAAQLRENMVNRALQVQRLQWAAVNHTRNQALANLGRQRHPPRNVNELSRLDVSNFQARGMTVQDDGSGVTIYRSSAPPSNAGSSIDPQMISQEQLQRQQRRRMLHQLSNYRGDNLMERGTRVPAVRTNYYASANNILESSTETGPVMGVSNSTGTPSTANDLGSTVPMGTNSDVLNSNVSNTPQVPRNEEAIVVLLNDGSLYNNNHQE